MHAGSTRGWMRGVLAAIVLATSAFSPGIRGTAVLPDGGVDDVAEVDVKASNAKIGQAYLPLVSMWSARFSAVGEEFVAPRLVAYRGPARTACGVMSPDNAVYCPASNAIYFDELFLARLADSAARELGTDGDMAAIGVVAHEVGHAVVMQLGADSSIPYENEAAADCLAGVFTAHSERAGSLEPGDLEEAFFGLAAAGDAPPKLTGDARTDRRILARAALLGHGTREQRLASFRSGYAGGAGACVPALR